MSEHENAGFNQPYEYGAPHTAGEELVEVTPEMEAFMIENNMLPQVNQESFAQERDEDHFDFELRISGRARMSRIQGMMQQNGLYGQGYSHQPARPTPVRQPYEYDRPVSEAAQTHAFVEEPSYTYGGIDPNVEAELRARDEADRRARQNDAHSQQLETGIIVLNENGSMADSSPNRAPSKKPFPVRTFFGALALLGSAVVVAGPAIHAEETGLLVAQECKANVICKAEKFVSANASNIFNFTPAKELS